ncbi:MAG TPA: hypothetical protein VKI44_19115, partial [Acetobacteraceae bacterium]|nr:hypothetical protein [Acetobacteraceae bacterium]
MILFTKKQEGFHEDHGAEENWRFARNRITAGAKRPNHPSCFFVKTFLLLRDGIESAGSGTGPPSHNELRVFAARSRRGSSVGRTRGCSGSVRRYGKFAQGGPYRGRCWWLSK